MTTPTPPPASQPTPRTDAYINAPDSLVIIRCGGRYPGHYIDADFARTLERDLAAVQQWQLEAVHEADDLRAQLAALRAQLEEAKAKRVDMGRIIVDLRNQLTADQLKAASRPVESPTPQKVPTGELFDAADKLNDYLLEISNWPMKDIPDEIYGPFAAALKNAESAPPATASAAQGDAP